MAKSILGTGMLIALALTVPVAAFCQEDRVAQVAIDTFKSHVRLPPGSEIKFLEKKESPILDFYAVKLLVNLPDKEIPTIVYVEKSSEKVSSETFSLRART
jgi:hypothetical protein